MKKMAEQLIGLWATVRDRVLRAQNAAFKAILFLKKKNDF